MHASDYQQRLTNTPEFQLKRLESPNNKTYDLTECMLRKNLTDSLGYQLQKILRVISTV